MSRIGRMPIAVPAGVTVEIAENNKVTVKGLAVDLRKGSPTFGKWHGEILSDENKKQFFIPKNFAHGFLVLSGEAEFCYKCTDFYHGDRKSTRLNSSHWS